jgi:hypothetical protein
VKEEGERTSRPLRRGASRAIARPSEIPETAEPPMFVYVRIPEDLDPFDRHDLFGDPLDAVLKRAAVGEVTGGGTALSAPDKDGEREVEYCGLDVDLARPRDGIRILIAELRRLGIPRMRMRMNANEGVTPSLFGSHFRGEYRHAHVSRASR